MSGECEVCGHHIMECLCREDCCAGTGLQAYGETPCPCKGSHPTDDPLRAAFRDERVKCIVPAVRNWMQDKRDDRCMEEVVYSALAAPSQPAKTPAVDERGVRWGEKSWGGW